MSLPVLLTVRESGFPHKRDMNPGQIRKAGRFQESSSIGLDKDCREAAYGKTACGQNSSMDKKSREKFSMRGKILA